MIGRLGRGFSRLRDSLQKTRDHLGEGIVTIVRGHGSFDEELWEDLEELLLSADTGTLVAEEIVRVTQACALVGDGLHFIGVLARGSYLNGVQRRRDNS